jgi:hypothetical protein
LGDQEKPLRRKYWMRMSDKEEPEVDPATAHCCRRTSMTEGLWWKCVCLKKRLQCPANNQSCKINIKNTPKPGS